MPIQRKGKINSEKIRIGIIIGMLAGLTFGLTAWLRDALALNAANVFFPWIKLASGIIPCILLGSFTGWLTARVDRLVITLIGWGLTGVCFAWWASNIPFGIQTFVLKMISPQLYAQVNYPFIEKMQWRGGMLVVIALIVALITAIFQGFIIEGIYNAISGFSKVAPALLWVASFAISGYLADNLIYSQLRAPVIAMNGVIQFVEENHGQKIPPEVARQRHTSSLTPVADLMTPTWKLILAHYDESIYITDVLVNFQDQWVTCQVLNNEEENQSAALLCSPYTLK